MRRCRDTILEGARAQDWEALNHLCASQAHALPDTVLDRLRSHGWVETFGTSHVITLAGRALLDSARYRQSPAKRGAVVK
jgi:ribosomal protein S19E (S16A)